MKFPALRRNIAILLSSVLMFSCIICANVSAGTTTFVDGFNEYMTNVANIDNDTIRLNMEKRGSSIIKNEADVGTVIWKLPILEKGKTYKFTAKYKPTNNSKLVPNNNGNWGFAIAAQSTNIPDNNIATGTKTEATLASPGKYEYTFNTGYSTEFWLRVNFTGCWLNGVQANGAEFYDFTLEDITPDQSDFAEHMTNSANIVSTTTVSNEKVGNGILFNEIDGKTIIWSLPKLQKGKTYKFKAKYKPINNSKLVPNSTGDWGFAIAPSSVGISNIVDNNIATGTKTEGTRSTPGEYIYTFSTLYDTDFNLRVSFTGCWLNGVQAKGVEFYDFALEDITPALPEESEFVKHMTDSENITVTTTTSNEKFGNGIIFNSIDDKSITWKLPILEKGKTYKFTAKFKPTNNSAIKFPSASDYAFAIAPEATNIPDNNIAVGTSTEATMSVPGTYEYTFTTGLQTSFWLRIGFSGCWLGNVQANGIHLYDFALEDITPPPTPESEFSKHMTNPDNIIYSTAGSKQKEDKSIVIKPVDNETIVWKLPELEKNKHYKFTAKFKPTNNSKVVPVAGDWGFAIATMGDVAKIPDNNIATGTATNGTLSTAGTYEYTFSTGGNTGFWLRTAFTGCWKSSVQADGVQFYDFALTEIENPNKPPVVNQWKIYNANDKTGFLSPTKVGAKAIIDAADNDFNGDGKSVKFIGINDAMAVTAFEVEKNTNYKITYKYFANSGVSDFTDMKYNFIVKENIVSNGQSTFGYANVGGNLAYTSFNQIITTENGDSSTQKQEWTEDGTNLNKDGMTGVWHTASIIFNSGSYETVYFGICGSYMTYDLWIDSLSIKQYFASDNPMSWKVYENTANGLSDTPSTAYIVDENKVVYKDTKKSIALVNTAGAHAVLPLEVEPNTDYVFSFYAKADSSYTGKKLLSAASILPENGKFDSPLASAVNDVKNVLLGKWNRYDFKFNSGANEFVYLVVDVDSTVTKPVYVDQFELLKDIDNIDALNSAEYWNVYDYGCESVNDGTISSWANVKDVKNKSLDQDGDGKVLAFKAFGQNAVSKLKVDKNTWYRITYKYYSEYQITNHYNRNFILEKTGVITNTASFSNYNATDGVFCMMGFTESYNSRGADVNKAQVSSSKNITALSFDIKEDVTEKWYDIEMFIYTGDYSEAWLSINFANKDGQAIEMAYVDTITFEKAKATLTNSKAENTYCEWTQNKVPNPSFEKALTDADWGQKLPNGISVQIGKAPQGDKYLLIDNARYVLEVKVEELVKYNFSVSMRQLSGNGGFVALATDPNGSEIITDYDSKDLLKIDAASDEWKRLGMEFLSTPNGIIYLVIDSTGGVLAVDDFVLCAAEYGTEYDPNDYTVYPVFDFERYDRSLVVKNNGLLENLKSNTSPETGDTGIAVVWIVLTVAITIVVLLSKKRKIRGVSI